MSDEKHIADEVLELANRIKPMLAGRAPEVQSAAIAELLSTWVLGFQIVDNLEATTDIQDEVLSGHIKLVLDLVEAGRPMAFKMVQDVRQWQP